MKNSLAHITSAAARQEDSSRLSLGVSLLLSVLVVVVISIITVIGVSG